MANIRSHVQMFPGQADRSAVGAHVFYAELSGEILSAFTGRSPPPDGRDIVCREHGASNHLALGLPSLAHHVGCIRGVVSEEKVIEANASPVVTPMKNAGAARNRASGEHPRYPVRRESDPARSLELTISLSAHGRGPLPAAVGLCHLLPESLSNRPLRVFLAGEEGRSSRDLPSVTIAGGGFMEVSRGVLTSVNRADGLHTVQYNSCQAGGNP